MPMKNPPHPGKLIKSDLEALDLSVAKGAEALGVSRSQLNRVISGDSSITADMAVRFEAVIGSTADMWVKLQAAYDLAQVRNSSDNPAKGLKRVVVPATPKVEQPQLI